MHSYEKRLLQAFAIFACSFMLSASGLFDSVLAQTGIPRIAGGGSSSLTIGTTPITGGATTQVLYNLAGVVSSDAGFTRTGVNGTTTIDNGSGAVSPLVVNDNGSPVFTIADGGLVIPRAGTAAAASIGPTAADGLSFTSTGIGFIDGGAYRWFVDVSGGNLTPFRLGSTGAFAWTSASAADGTADTLLTRENAAIVQMGLDVNGAAVTQTFKAHDGITGTDVAGANFIFAGGRGTGAGASGNVIFQTSPDLATGTTAQTLVSREVIVGKQFTYADNTIITFAVITLGNDTYAGGSIDYCIKAADATTAGQECGRGDFSAVDVTAGAGGEVCTFTKVGTPAQALSGSTLAVTLTGTTGTDLCNLRITADTNIASPTVLKMTYRIINNSTQVITPQ